MSIIIRIIAITLLLAFATSSNADSLKSLLMPGPVINGHEKYEDNCSQCHDTADKNNQAKLCTQCHAHKNVLKDINKDIGFHGQLSKSEKNNCKHCHTEHKGREAKIDIFNLSLFDHKKTDFPLNGGHKKTTCKSCHMIDKKYSEAKTQCYGCHKRIDIHEGKQGEKCNDCHNTNSWTKVKFDHDDTDFPLTKTHKKTSCSSCHLNKKYSETPKTCFSCHKIDDTHQSTFGKKCETCHSTDQWKKVDFDHNKKTDFSLFGKHRKSHCNDCHIPNKKINNNTTTCFSCHANDDNHKGRYGKTCKTCHAASSWQKNTFNHDKKTDFPLIEKHADINCNQCHQGNIYKNKLGSSCFSCHKNDDIHLGKQGQSCNDCHNETSWTSNLSFDHDLLSFPLIGMHSVAPCEECHVSFDFSKAESKCFQCHSDVDIHKKSLGTNCHTCHNPNAWDTWLFNHDKSTNFKLDGAHTEAQCDACHQTPLNIENELPSDCYSCHRHDDIHNSQFGRQCKDCHITKDFKNINFKQ